MFNGPCHQHLRPSCSLLTAPAIDCQY